MIDFMKAIWGDQVGYAELRVIGDSIGSVESRFFKYPSDFERVSNAVTGYVTYTNKNVFAGVMLRFNPAGKAEDVVKLSHVLWADFDMKRFDEDRMKTFGTIMNIDIPPQIIVDSGHGFHTYWLLDEFIDTSLAQRIMKGIALKYGGDIVGDPARVMRLPGTYNVKDPENPVLVRMLRFNPLERTRVVDMLDYEYIEREIDKYNPYKVGSPKDDEIEERLTYSFPKGQRSELIFGLVCDAIRAGWEEDEIGYALMNNPAGEKVQEMTPANGAKWIARTYNAAVQAINLEANR